MKTKEAKPEAAKIVYYNVKHRYKGKEIIAPHFTEFAARKWIHELKVIASQDPNVTDVCDEVFLT